MIVCDFAGILAGSSQRRTSSAICHCHEAGCIITLRSVGRWDLLHDVWARMKEERNLKNIPVVNQESRPLGLLHARDIEVLLKNPNSETHLSHL